MSSRNVSASAIVLAGGASRRLGRDKSRELVGGVPLLQRVVDAVAPLASEVILSVAPDSTQEAFRGARLARDLRPGSGVLGGIHAGLEASRTPYSLVVACDMPFLNKALLRYVLSLAPGYDLVLPRPGGLTEPAHAVYSRECIPHIARLLEEGQRRIATLFPLVRVRYVEDDEVDRFDQERLSFFNVNTEADLARAREVAARLDSLGRQAAPAPPDAVE